MSSLVLLKVPDTRELCFATVAGSRIRFWVSKTHILGWTKCCSLSRNRRYNQKVKEDDKEHKAINQVIREDQGAGVKSTIAISARAGLGGQEA